MLDDTAWTQIRLALRRSRVRVAILLALRRLGDAYLADLCREGSTTPPRARGAIYGDEGSYRREEALVTLGLVRVASASGEPRYALTPLGHMVAAAYQREMLAELGRAARART